MPHRVSCAARFAVAALLSVLAAACRSIQEPELSPNAPLEIAPTAALPLAITGRVTLEAGDVDGPPGLLRGVVTLRNPGSRAVTVVVTPCDPVVRAWPDSVRSGAPALELGGAGTHCAAADRSVTIAPGGSEPLETAYSGGYVLGELPEGRYRFVLTARIGDQTVHVDGGTVDVRSGLSSLQTTAASSIEGIAPASLVTRATLRNTGSSAVRLEYSVCNVSVWAYRAAARTGTPAWKSELRAPPKSAGTYTYGCPLPLYQTRLDPGASISAPFSLAVPTYEVLADTLPEGRYYLVARVFVNWRTVSVPAGEVTLTRAQAPLPASRAFGGVSFTAASRTVRAANGTDSLEIALTLANGDARPHAVAPDPSVGGCLVSVAGYRDVARRDAYYLYGGTDWVAHPACPFVIPSVTLAAGETRTLRGNVGVPPGKVHLALFAWLAVDGVRVRPDVAAGSTP